MLCKNSVKEVRFGKTSSVKDKLHLKYLINKIIWKNTQIFHAYLLYFIRTFSCFLWLCSKTYCSIKMLLWKKQPSRNCVEIMFAFNVFHEGDQILPRKWQPLTAESPFKMMKNAFYFTLKSLLVLKIFKFLSWIFSNVKKRLD